jgi:PPOX class probable F420-dependent enzyme
VGKNERSKITLTDDEVVDYIQQSRTATMATIGPNGLPHLVAMWYGVIDGEIWFETKTKSQKAQNLRRDPRMTCMIEDGYTYDTLRGVSIEGTAEIIDDADQLWALGIQVWERYTGPYTEEMKPFLEVMLHNRVAVRLIPERTRSWDHRKLGMDAMPLGGTTAEFLPRLGSDAP